MGLPAVKKPPPTPPLMTRLKMVAEKPGESRTVTVEVAEADVRREKLAVAVEGFNVTAGR